MYDEPSLPVNQRKSKLVRKLIYFVSTEHEVESVGNTIHGNEKRSIGLEVGYQVQTP